MVTWVSASKNETNPDRDPCKVCDGKGAFRCPMCSDGLASCPPCAGRGRLESTCPDCAGGKKLPCPGCTVNPKGRACPFCRNERKVECALCKPGGPTPPEVAAKARCLTCAATGTVRCDDCYATGRIACSPCGGTGRIRSEIVGTGEKAGKKSCQSCKGAGFLKCERCKNGRADCATCTGGEVNVRCSGCRDVKTVRCRGCFPGEWMAFETCGRLLHAASRFEEAGAFYTTGLRRFSAVAATMSVSNSPEVKRSVDAWLDETRARLEAEVLSAEQKKPPPAPK
jgi:hypothetical protein